MNPVRIVAIDDEEALLHLLRRFLAQRGHQVTTCNRAALALDLFKQDPNQFDLAIADLAMPDMSGEELLHTLLEMAPQLRVLVCSGYPFDPENVAPALQGRVGFLQKPFMPNMLEEAIQRLVSPAA